MTQKKDDAPLLPVYLRKKGTQELVQQRQTRIRMQDPGIVISSEFTDLHKTYIILRTKADLINYMKNNGLPSNIVIQDNLYDYTPCAAMELIIAHLEDHDLDPTPIRLKLECYEIEYRAKIRKMLDDYAVRYAEKHKEQT